MKQEDATFPRKNHQFVAVAYFIQAGLLVMKKLFLLLGLHFASISPADSEPLKDPSLGLRGLTVIARLLLVQVFSLYYPLLFHLRPFCIFVILIAIEHILHLWLSIV